MPRLQQSSPLTHGLWVWLNFDSEKRSAEDPRTTPTRQQIKSGELKQSQQPRIFEDNESYFVVDPSVFLANVYNSENLIKWLFNKHRNRVLNGWSLRANQRTSFLGCPSRVHKGLSNHTPKPHFKVKNQPMLWFMLSPLRNPQNDLTHLFKAKTNLLSQCKCLYCHHIQAHCFLWASTEIFVSTRLESINAVIPFSFLMWWWVRYAIQLAAMLH